MTSGRYLKASLELKSSNVTGPATENEIKEIIIIILILHLL